MNKLEKITGSIKEGLQGTGILVGLTVAMYGPLYVADNIAGIIKADKYDRPSAMFRTKEVSRTALDIQDNLYKTIFRCEG